MTGSGTLIDPYVIWDVDDLQDMNLDLTAYYELGQDIDAAVTVGWNGGLGFDPVGNFGGMPPDPLRFSGYFDGKGHIISNLFINRPLERFVGLFGITNYGVTGYIRNVTLASVDITGLSEVGSLVGFHEWMTDFVDGIVSNVHTSGAIKGITFLVGGLLGYNGASVEDCDTRCSVTVTGTTTTMRQNGGFTGLNDGQITRCFATGNVTCEHSNVGSDIREIGGFVGLQNANTITECYATGNVLINSDAVALDDVYSFGGFVGDSQESISDCYSRGNVTVTAGTGTAEAVGGFVGIHTSATLDNCYATGTVSATGLTAVGGFCGDNYSTITNCFWDTEISGQATSEGGTGKITVDMKDSSTFIIAGWGFGAEWGMTPLCNDGYPCLLTVTSSCLWAPVVIPPLTAPSVITLPATHITEHQAQLNGMIENDGGNLGFIRFEWGSTTAYGNITPWRGHFGDGYEFDETLDQLAEAAAFHFRAVFRNNLGTFYGRDLTFSTLGPLGPVVLMEDELAYLLEAT